MTDQQTADPAAAAPAGPKPGEPAASQSRSGDKVTVACKLPNGMLLRVFRMVPHSEPVMGGGTKQTERAEQLGEPVKVHGPAIPFGAQPRGPISGGFALTSIDKGFWELWLSQNRDSDAVKNNLIFAAGKMETAAGMADDRSDVQSGLQPLVPDKDKRIPRAASGNLSPVSTDTDAKRSAA